jgi:hypothetical protein
MRQWIRSRLTYANVMVTILAFVVLGGVSYAATGGNFILGNANTASSKSTLSAPIADKALQVTNTSTGVGATALGLSVASGHTPFTINSGAKVANLNADKLDNKDSAAFQGWCSAGAIKGSLVIDTNGFTSSTFQNVAGFNCFEPGNTTTSVQMKRLGTGSYEVWFVGNQGANASGSAVCSGFFNFDIVQCHAVPGGTDAQNQTVFVVGVAANDGTFVDDDSWSLLVF